MFKRGKMGRETFMTREAKNASLEAGVSGRKGSWTENQIWSLFGCPKYMTHILIGVSVRCK